MSSNVSEAPDARRLSAEDWISHHADLSPEKEAMRALSSGRRFTYQALNERVARAARHFRDVLGVARGERIAILSHNDSDVFEIQFACRRIGAIFLPLNWRLAVPELEFICNDATPKILVYGNEFEAESHDIKARCGTRHLVSIANGAPSDYETGLAEAEPLPLTESPALALDDVWTIMYTSGTTGRPKGAQITYSMAVFNAVHSSMRVELTRRSTNLVFLPTFHTGGLNVFANPVFHTGGTNIVMRTFNPTDFLALLADKNLRITHVFGVPTNFLMLAEEQGFADADLSHVVFLGIGGAAAPAAVIEQYAEKNIMLQQGWGMTETGPLGLVILPEDALDRIGSSGKPVLHTRLKICDEEGQEVGPGVTGELMIKGPTITPGYWNRPEANQNAFTEDGWFHTGDAARTDEDGFYYIVDRWKDMFISGGENVYPVEVEDVIFQLDGVLENAVIGVPHEKWGEVGRAFVVLKPGVNLTEAAVVDHCEENLARYKVPKEVRFIDELPHNATGKVLKHELSRD